MDGAGLETFGRHNYQSYCGTKSGWTRAEFAVERTKTRGEIYAQKSTNHLYVAMQTVRSPYIYSKKWVLPILQQPGTQEISPP